MLVPRRCARYRGSDTRRHLPEMNRKHTDRSSVASRDVAVTPPPIHETFFAMADAIEAVTRMPNRWLQRDGKAYFRATRGAAWCETRIEDRDVRLRPTGRAAYPQPRGRWPADWCRRAANQSAFYSYENCVRR